MLIKEYRIYMPMTVDEYRIAQLYMIAKKSRHESEGAGSGIEIHVNRPYEDGPGPSGQGQYTQKTYHIGKRLPGWVKQLVPKTALSLSEEAWNDYPYTRTKFTTAFLKNFSLDVETMYFDDRGEQENVFNLGADELAQREVEYMDLVNDAVPSGKYVAAEDPKLFQSARTGRGPLTANWLDEHPTIMCAYKLCRIEAKYWGFQTKLERFIDAHGLRNTMVVAHRQAWAWQDEYHGMTIGDIRNYEVETAQALAHVFGKAEEPPKQPRHVTIAPKHAGAPPSPLTLSASAVHHGQSSSATTSIPTTPQDFSVSVISLPAAEGRSSVAIDRLRSLEVENGESATRLRRESIKRRELDRQATLIAEEAQDDSDDDDDEFFDAPEGEDPACERPASRSHASTTYAPTDIVIIVHGECLAFAMDTSDVDDVAVEHETLVQQARAVLGLHYGASGKRLAFESVLCPSLGKGVHRQLRSVLMHTRPEQIAPSTLALFALSSLEYRQMVRHVVSQCNAAYARVLQAHPGFSGRVSIVGDSVGGMAVFDIVTMREAHSTFDFDVHLLFTLGSPIPLMMARLQNETGSVPPPPACSQFYNLVLRADMLAGRIEPLLCAPFRKIDPAVVPSYQEFPLGLQTPQTLEDAVQRHEKLFARQPPRAVAMDSVSDTDLCADQFVDGSIIRSVLINGVRASVPQDVMSRACGIVIATIVHTNVLQQRPAAVGSVWARIGHGVVSSANWSAPLAVALHALPDDTFNALPSSPFYSHQHHHHHPPGTRRSTLSNSAAGSPGTLRASQQHQQGSSGNLSDESVPAQQIVLLIMSPHVLDRLVSLDMFTLGDAVTSAAGPVSVHTTLKPLLSENKSSLSLDETLTTTTDDPMPNADVLSYAVYGADTVCKGVSIEGAVCATKQSANAIAYGNSARAADILGCPPHTMSAQHSRVVEWLCAVLGRSDTDTTALSLYTVATSAPAATTTGAFTSNSGSNASILSTVSTAAGGGSSATNEDVRSEALERVRARWWGVDAIPRRLDFHVACPDGLDNFPSYALMHILHASYWESADVAAFIVRELIQHDGDISPDASLAVTSVPFTMREPRMAWLRTRTRFKIKGFYANHRAADVVVRQGEPVQLSGRFSYGALDYVTLSGEEVVVFVCRAPPHDEWLRVGTAKTNSHGRIELTINSDDDVTLGVGVYPVKFVVRGDHSTTSCNIFVLPEHSQAVIFAIDGSFAATASISGASPRIQRGSVELARFWANLGYLIIYISGRPKIQLRSVVNWLHKHSFPNGVVSLRETLSKDPTKQKAQWLRETRERTGVEYVAAYGSGKDIAHYEELGIDSTRVFVAGRASDRAKQKLAPKTNAQMITDGYEQHISAIQGKVEPAAVPQPEQQAVLPAMEAKVTSGSVVLGRHSRNVSVDSDSVISPLNRRRRFGGAVDDSSV